MKPGSILKYGGLKMRISTAGKVWFVIRCNIKCEQKAMENLQAAGFEVYFPRMRKDIIHHRTKAVITREFPLFNRYLFVGMPQEAERRHWGFVRACEGVECALGVGGVPLPVPAADVEAFRLAEIDMQFDDTRAAKIHRGDIEATKKAQVQRLYPTGSALRVKEGHDFGGFYGNVVSTKGAGKVKAMIEMFGGLIPVEFNVEDVEPIADAA